MWLNAFKRLKKEFRINLTGLFNHKSRIKMNRKRNYTTELSNY